MSSSPFANRLAHEKSPYLRQHAGNPVDWFPWGDEAIERARREEKPIFLSVGYSTCHWCHVMERESFENDDVAALLNESFVCIKVDREEHPDVDQLYMSAVQRMTRQGGWPMSVWMTPDLEPFYAGTYFPPESRWGKPGFADLLRNIAEVWRNRRGDLLKQAAQIVDLLAREEAAPRPGVLASVDPIHHAVLQLERGFDPVFGGFGEAPKFPRSTTLSLILRDRLLRDDVGDRRLAMVEKTLEMMWRGGIYDHLAGGFARYSTDDRWLVPHFEKMLYDNALLALAYVEAWQVTRNDDHRRVVAETFAWADAEMRHENGGYFSALDADSEGEEGRFYVWTQDEIRAALGAEADFAMRIFGAVGAANFEGRFILHLPASLNEAAEREGIDRGELERRLAAVRERLHEVRAPRVRPGLDDKVLTSWNGLMIAALARAGAVLGERPWIDRAIAAADFVERHLTDAAAGLLRRWREDDAAYSGTLEDYAFFAWGLLELFEATGEARYLDRASALAERALELFEDAEHGGFHLADRATPHLILRTKEPYDGATPSGNSVMAYVLARLADWRDREDWRAAAERAVSAFAGELERFPMAYPFLLCVLDRLRAPSEQVVIVDGDDAEAAERLERRAREEFLPRASVVRVRPHQHAPLARLVPWLAGKEAPEGRSAVWVCRDFTCRRPAFTPEELDFA